MTLIEHILLDWIVELATFAPSIAISLFAGVSRSIVQESRRSSSTYVRAICVAIFVGILTKLGAEYWGTPRELVLLACGVMAFIGDDVLAGILYLSHKFRNNPWEAFKKALIKMLSK
jgi:hypothetical protein